MLGLFFRHATLMWERSYSICKSFSFSSSLSAFSSLAAGSTFQLGYGYGHRDWSRCRVIY